MMIRLTIAALLFSGILAAKTARGVVVDENDAPVAKATVMLESDSQFMVRSQITGPEGTFSFSGLNDNAYYKLKARAGDRTSNDEKISPYDNLDNKTIKLRLESK